MIIYPAIDIKDGQCVRLAQGKEDQVKVYDSDPVKMAAKWQEDGAEILHIIDLDGAIKGTPKNLDTVKKIAQAVDIPVQFGGGVRKIETLKDIIEAGVAQVVLGTAVISDVTFVGVALRLFGERIVIGLDASNGKIAIEGWKKVTDKDVIELARSMEDLGASRIVYTDISKDGMLVGPNIDDTKRLAEAIDVPVIASGGVSSLDDIRSVKTLEAAGVEGVIIGKALYEQAFTLEDALEVGRSAG